MYTNILLLFLLSFIDITAAKTTLINTPVNITANSYSASIIYPIYQPVPLINNRVVYTPTTEDIYVFLFIGQSNDYRIFPITVTSSPTDNTQQLYSFIIYDPNNPYTANDVNVFDKAKTLNVELRIWPVTNPSITSLRLDKYVTGTYPMIITYNKVGKVYPAPPVFPRNSDELLNYYKTLSR